MEVGSSLGVDVQHWASGPAFGDIDGDGDLDLFVGSVLGDPIYLFENRLNEEEESFVDITESSHLRINAASTVSALFFDYDIDGYVDLFLTHWGQIGRQEETPSSFGETTETARSLTLAHKSAWGAPLIHVWTGVSPLS